MAEINWMAEISNVLVKSQEISQIGKSATDIFGHWDSKS